MPLASSIEGGNTFSSGHIKYGSWNVQQQPKESLRKIWEFTAGSEKKPLKQTKTPFPGNGHYKSQTAGM